MFCETHNFLGLRVKLSMIIPTKFCLLSHIIRFSLHFRNLLHFRNAAKKTSYIMKDNIDFPNFS